MASAMFQYSSAERNARVRALPGGKEHPNLGGHSVGLVTNVAAHRALYSLLVERCPAWALRSAELTVEAQAERAPKPLGIGPTQAESLHKISGVLLNALLFIAVQILH